MNVVGISCQGRQRVIERHHAKALLTIEAGAFDHVADKMGRSGGAAPISANENVAVLLTRTRQNLDRLAHLFQIDAIDGLENVGLISFWKGRAHRVESASSSIIRPSRFRAISGTASRSGGMA